jgi:membrane-bound serine protease (ClpP class)
MYWVWAILLLVLGMGLAVMEVFFPSAGILGFLSASAILAAIVMGFQDGMGTGLAILGVAVFGIPAVLVLAFRYWPRTAMGRRVLLMAPRSDEVLPDDAERRHLKGLVGKVGRAKCKMLPGGVVTIEGRSIEAVSEGVFIEAGQSVRVIAVRANRAVVRLVEDEAPSASAEDPLQRPIDTVAPDPFGEPPA